MTNIAKPMSCIYGRNVSSIWRISLGLASVYGGKGHRYGGVSIDMGDIWRKGIIGMMNLSSDMAIYGRTVSSAWRSIE